MRLVETTRSWSGTTGDWMRSRGLVILRALVRRGLGVHAAFAVGITLLAHLWRECGAGSSEWDNNPGNIKAHGNELGAMRTNVHDGTQPYRVFDSIESGIEAYLAKLEGSRYGPALGQLITRGDGRAWYADIMREGYHPFSENALTEWERIHRRMTGV
ncbi:MAG: hypothetical protein Q8Q09_02725 [Deltaproteobacteria bacterium]|nr:hypothetical protein [Deltaproteobacteria bacterium]